MWKAAILALFVVVPSFGADRYVVALQKDAGTPAVVAAELLQGGGVLGHVYTHAVQGFSASLPPGAAATLSADPRVRYVEAVTDLCPSGVQFQPGWALDRIDARPRTRDARYVYPGTGAGVNVYVIDSGIVPHADFGQRLQAAYDTIPSDSATPLTDPTGHGTSVAGIIGGSTYGVAKGVTLHSVCNVRWEPGYNPYIGVHPTIEDTIEALDWIAAHHRKPAVVNLSQNTYSGGAMIDEAVRGVLAAGVMVVSSAGNGSNEMISSPAVPEGLIVGAIDGLDRRVANTAHGVLVDLFAPGQAVDTTSAWGGFTAFSYTSAAAPMVTGAVALYLEKHPLATPAEVHQWIVGNATTGLVTNMTVWSPNRILFVPPVID